MGGIEDNVQKSFGEIMKGGKTLRQKETFHL